MRNKRQGTERLMEMKVKEGKKKKKKGLSTERLQWDLQAESLATELVNTPQLPAQIIHLAGKQYLLYDLVKSTCAISTPLTYITYQSCFDPYPTTQLSAGIRIYAVRCSLRRNCEPDAPGGVVSTFQGHIHTLETRFIIPQHAY